MKKLLYKIHLWLSIPLGIIITIICFTGATLVFEQDITRALNKNLYQVEIPQGKERLSPSEVINILQEKHDGMKLSQRNLSDKLQQRRKESPVHQSLYRRKHWMVKIISFLSDNEETAQMVP